MSEKHKFQPETPAEKPISKENIAQKIEELYPQLLGFAKRLCGQKFNFAEDIVQAACVKALSTKSQVEGTGEKGFDGWLFKIVRNEFYDRIRKKDYEAKTISPKSLSTPLHPKHGISLADASALSEDRILSKIYFEKVRSYQLKGSLVIDPIDMEIISMRAAGKKNKEIAEILGIEPQTISVRIIRLREKIEEKEANLEKFRKKKK